MIVVPSLAKPGYKRPITRPSYYNAPRTFQTQEAARAVYEKRAINTGAKVVGTIKQKQTKVFKGFFEYYAFFPNGKTYKVQKNNIEFYPQLLNNRVKPARKWWWTRTKTNTVNNVPVYKNTITGEKATVNGTPVNRTANGEYSTNGN